MPKSPEYLYLEFLSGFKRKECLYRYGTDDDPTLFMVRLTFRGEAPHTVYVPNHLSNNEELIHMMDEEIPDAEVQYFGDGD